MLSDRFLDPKSEWPEPVKEPCKKTQPALLFCPTSRHMVLSQETSGSDRGFGSRHPANRRPVLRNKGLINLLVFTHMALKSQIVLATARAPRWRSRTPKQSPTCYLTSSRQTSSPTSCPRCFKNGKRTTLPGPAKLMDFTSQKRKSKEVEPARLRAGRQRVGCVGCFQIHGTRGWRGMDVFKCSLSDPAISRWQKRKGERKTHSSRKGSLNRLKTRRSLNSTSNTTLIVLLMVFTPCIQYRNIKNLEPTGCQTSSVSVACLIRSFLTISNDMLPQRPHEKQQEFNRASTFEV